MQRRHGQRGESVAAMMLAQHAYVGRLVPAAQVALLTCLPACLPACLQLNTQPFNLLFLLLIERWCVMTPLPGTRLATSVSSGGSVAWACSGSVFCKGCGAAAGSLQLGKLPILQLHRLAVGRLAKRYTAPFAPPDCRLAINDCLLQSLPVADADRPGRKPWISEMYGYSFGCSSSNVWHHVDYAAMLYPTYKPVGECTDGAPVGTLCQPCGCVQKALCN